MRIHIHVYMQYGETAHCRVPLVRAVHKYIIIRLIATNVCMTELVEIRRERILH